MSRVASSYVLVLSLSCAAIGLVLDVGSEPSRVVDGSPRVYSRVHSPPLHATTGSAFASHLREPLGVLLCQIVVILASARILGAICVRVGQPGVIGEMLAGIALGPSVLGKLAPNAMTFLFPPTSLETLHLFSQIGVILYMFTVGAGVDMRQLRRDAHAVVWVSHAGIILPFLLGTTLSLAMYPSMAPAGVTFRAFALFIGTAMSVTAFPVLARIVQERGLFRSPAGSTALACAAVDDVTAWCLLAAVVAVVRADGLATSLIMLILVVSYCTLMVFVVKPLLTRLPLLQKTAGAADGPHRTVLTAAVPAFALLAGLTTHVIGIHAVFGAFLAGMILPAHCDLRSAVTSRFDSISTGLLLPLFFAVTGLRTEIALIDSPSTQVLCATVVILAVVGKFGGALFAARWSGMNWQDCVLLGALMNTRGLMELIVLNVGYDLGILTAPVFAIFVVMALTTTMMTTPLVALAQAMSSSAYPGSKRPVAGLGS